MRQTILAICIVCCGLCVAQSAGAITALEMSSFCEQVDNARQLGDGKVLLDTSDASNRCWGAFLAIQGLSTITFTGVDGPALRICAPAKSTLIQFVKIYRTYVADHPENGHEDFVIIAWRSLNSAYPCE